MTISFNNALKSIVVAASATFGIPVFADTNHPTTHFTFIHSAWMGGWQWQGLIERLGNTARAAAPDLAAHGAAHTNPANVTLDTYVEDMIAEIDQVDGNTILVAHSFGGIVASQVAEARPNKIDAIVYLCAFMLPNNVSFMDATGGVTNSQVLNNLVFSKDGTTLSIAEDALHGAVAHDVPLETFALAQSNLVAEPVVPLGAKLQLTSEAYGSVPRYYIECTEDQAIPVDLQRAMYGQQQVEKVYSLSTSHVPMFSNPDGVLAALTDIAGREYVRNATKIASQAWQDAFNAGDATAAAAFYEKDALMVASPYGTFSGHDQIKAFWTDLIGKGAAEIEYIEPRLEVLDATSAQISSRWKMNLAHGVITNEFWVLQDDGTMLLRKDYFTVE